MQKKVDEILAQLIGQLIPDRIPRGELERICRATKLSQSTLRMARLRQSVSADTLVKLLLAHGVSPSALRNLPRNRPSKLSETLTQWNKIGLNLSEQEREKLGKFVKALVAEWKVK